MLLDDIPCCRGLVMSLNDDSCCIPRIVILYVLRDWICITAQVCALIMLISRLVSITSTDLVVDIQNTPYRTHSCRITPYAMSSYRSSTAIAQVTRALPTKVHRPRSWQVDDAFNASTVSVKQQLKHHYLWNRATTSPMPWCQNTVQQAVMHIATE